VPLGEEAEIWLEEYLNKARPLLARSISPPQVIFLTWRGCRFGCSAVGGLVHRWAKKAGLEKNVTPHCLRHSCATHMLRRGANLRYLQQLLGHAYVDTTEGYTRVEISDLHKVLLRCHPRECKK
jgi:integrase/recombinase XerD